MVYEGCLAFLNMSDASLSLSFIVIMAGTLVWFNMKINYHYKLTFIFSKFWTAITNNSYKKHITSAYSLGNILLIEVRIKFKPKLRHQSFIDISRGDKHIYEKQKIINIRFWIHHPAIGYLHLIIKMTKYILTKINYFLQSSQNYYLN